MPHLAQHLYALLHLIWPIPNLTQVIPESCVMMGAGLSQLCHARDLSVLCPCACMWPGHGTALNGVQPTPKSTPEPLLPPSIPLLVLTTLRCPHAFHS